MEYPRKTPVNPYYPLHTSTSSNLPLFSPGDSKRFSAARHNASPRSISPHRIVEKIYLQRDSENPVSERKLEFSPGVDKKVIQQLDQRFEVYKFSISRKYEHLFSRAKELTSNISNRAKKSIWEHPTALKKSAEIVPGCL